MACGTFVKPALVRKMLDTLELTPDDMLLDPIAGHGFLVQTILDGAVPAPRSIVLMDPDEERYEFLKEMLELNQPNIPTLAVHGNFLKMRMFRPTAIIMNTLRFAAKAPAYIKHGYKLLAPCGRLVALVPESELAGVNRETSEFTHWMRDGSATVFPAPEHFFSGTKTPVRLVHIRKTSTVPVNK